MISSKAEEIMTNRRSIRRNAPGITGVVFRAPVLALLAALSPLPAREATPRPPAAKAVAAAREIMAAQTYCALITLGEDGRPQARTMSPLPPEGDLTVWFATNTRSRKVQDIRRDPRVTLYFADHSHAIGYLALTGRAVLIEDMAEIRKRKRAYWDQAFPDLKDLVLIKVVPERLEVLNYQSGDPADPITWRAPSVDLVQPAAKP
jgi:general stress protein 26